MKRPRAGAATPAPGPSTSNRSRANGDQPKVATARIARRSSPGTGSDDQDPTRRRSDAARDAAAVAGGARPRQDLSRAAYGALDGLSITVAPGEVFGLLGPNGAGKSTTVKILTTLARPDSGTATVAGHDVLRHPDRVRRVIGVVAQRSGADPWPTGRDNLVLQGRLYGHARAPRCTRRVDELLDRFDLADAADRPVRTYSGGMQRRLDVALGLVHRPAGAVPRRADRPASTRRPAPRCGRRSAGWPATRRWRSCSPPTTWTRPTGSPTGWPSWTVAGSSSRARRTSSRASCAATPYTSSCARTPERAGRAAGTRAPCPACGTSPLDGRRLSARADDGAATVPAALAALDQAGVPVAAVTVARPSLDDVYLRHAGRRFAEAEAPVTDRVTLEAPDEHARTRPGG